MSQKSLAKICKTDTPTMSRIIDKLDECGYIIRKRDLNDFRCVTIELSEKGMGKSTYVPKELNGAYDEVFSKLSEEEKKSFSHCFTGCQIKMSLLMEFQILNDN